jgi:hypothetical protein
MRCHNTKTMQVYLVVVALDFVWLSFIFKTKIRTMKGGETILQRSANAPSWIDGFVSYWSLSGIECHFDLKYRFP